MINIRFGTVCNFIESPDTVMDNMKEISPTVTCGVPRIWEKYASGIMIRMSDATWFKRMVFKASLGIGMKYAGLKLNFKPIPLYLKLAYSAAYGAVFRKLKERLGFDRVRVAYSGAAPISPDVLKFFNAIGLPLIEGTARQKARVSPRSVVKAALRSVRLDSLARGGSENRF